MSLENTISVVINTLNEEANLAQCLDTVKGLADEIVIVDMHSEDKTIEIAKRYNAKVYFHKRLGYADPARNFAFSKATSHWILMLDADERIPKELAHELKRVASVKNSDIKVLYIPRKNLWFNRWIEHSLWWPDYHPRFFVKGSLSWPKEVHGHPLVDQKKSKYLPQEHELAILHHSIDSISRYISTLNRYTSLEVERMSALEVPFKRRHLILAPWREFRLRFFGEGKGYKDGFDGLAISLMQAFYRFVSVLKYWEKQKLNYADKNKTKLGYLYSLVFDRGLNND